MDLFFLYLYNTVSSGLLWRLLVFGQTHQIARTDSSPDGQSHQSPNPSCVFAVKKSTQSHENFIPRQHCCPLFAFLISRRLAYALTLNIKAISRQKRHKNVLIVPYWPRQVWLPCLTKTHYLCRLICAEARLHISATNPCKGEWPKLVKLAASQRDERSKRFPAALLPLILVPDSMKTVDKSVWGCNMTAGAAVSQL